ncbi:hypothetical protein KCP69_26285 [Salmonella enterica subsp. enterica]|nr:hypothetical protein KCP69_26285 [Salmonella enterica subsp. enterica]
MWDGGFALSVGRHPANCNTHHTSLHFRRQRYCFAISLYAAIDLTLFPAIIHTPLFWRRSPIPLLAFPPPPSAEELPVAT